MASPSPNDRATMVKSAGGCKVLVERVIGELERGLLLHKRDEGSFDEEFFEPLRPDLDALIQITEEVLGLMQSGSVLYDKRLQEADRAVGDCRASVLAKQGELSQLNKELAECEVAAVEDKKKFADLERELHQTMMEIDKFQEKKEVDRKLSWIPGYVFISEFEELILQREPALAKSWEDAHRRINSTSDELRDLAAKRYSLAESISGTDSTIHDLEDSRKVIERNRKVYANRFALLSEFLWIFTKLRTKMGNIKDYLDLPNMVESFYERREVVLLNGEAHQVPLKVVLMHLGENYDRYLEHRGLEERAGISFKLFRSREPLPSTYRLATVHEVINNREALFKAMPKWQVANLADGAVHGNRYHGFISREIRNGVGHKLAVDMEPRLIESTSVIDTIVGFGAVYSSKL